MNREMTTLRIDKKHFLGDGKNYFVFRSDKYNEETIRADLFNEEEKILHTTLVRGGFIGADKSIHDVINEFEVFVSR